MIEFFDGEDLDEVKSVMFTEADMEEIRYALDIQRNKCKRLALELRRYVRAREASGETYVNSVLERQYSVEQAQNDYGKLQRLILARSVWVPKD